jgi:hypothetical protein
VFSEISLRLLVSQVYAFGIGGGGSLTNCSLHIPQSICYLEASPCPRGSGATFPWRSQVMPSALSRLEILKEANIKIRFPEIWHRVDRSSNWTRCTRCRRVVSIMPRMLCPRYPLDRTEGGPENRSGRRGEKFCIPGNQSPAVQPVVRRYSD